MYFMGLYLFCPGDLVTHMGEWKIWSASGRHLNLNLNLNIISIYTLSDLGILSNLIGSLSLANEHYSPPTE